MRVWVVVFFYFRFLSFCVQEAAMRLVVTQAQQSASFLLMRQKSYVAMKHAKAAGAKRKNKIKGRHSWKESLWENRLFLGAIITPRRVNSSNKSTFPRSQTQIRGGDKRLNPLNEAGVALSTLLFHFITGWVFFFFTAHCPLKRYSND